MSVEVNNESGVDVDEAEIVALARHVLAQMHVHPQAELSVVLVDETAMEQLHVAGAHDESLPLRVARNVSSSLRCRPNISFSSSGSAWS